MKKLVMFIVLVAIIVLSQVAHVNSNKTGEQQVEPVVQVVEPQLSTPEVEIETKQEEVVKPPEPPRVEAPPKKPKPVAKPSVAADKVALMTQAGINSNDFQYVDYIISKESGWRYSVWNTAGSGAYGLCQSLPASKMASAGADYLDNPVTQLKWCNSYAIGRYGSWAAAYNFWQSRHWW